MTTVTESTRDRSASSPTRGRHSISDSFASLGTKLSKVLTNDSHVSGSTNTAVTESGGPTNDRSRSRGRDVVFASSGRGGAGNMRSLSTDPQLRPTPENVEDDGSSPRGREMEVSAKAMSSGRGGAGNIRSPSKEQAAAAAGAGRGESRSRSRGPDAVERDILAKHMAKQEAEGVRSSGRGGAGNMVFPPQSPNDTERSGGTTLEKVWEKVRSASSSRPRDHVPAQEPLAPAPVKV